MPIPDETEAMNDPQSSGQNVPEMIAATDKPFLLTANGARITLRIHAPAGPARLRKPEMQEVFLLVENVTCEKAAPNFLAYLNVPAGEDPEKHRELYAGVMGMFGLAEATAAKARHGGSGLRFTFDITDLYRKMQQRHLWNGQQLEVSFIADMWDPPIPQVQVGRVSLYMQ